MKLRKLIQFVCPFDPDPIGMQLEEYDKGREEPLSVTALAPLPPARGNGKGRVRNADIGGALQ